MPETVDSQRPSKSERKRAHRRIQILAGQLSELPAREINKLAVSEQAKEELVQVSRMPASSARMRQLRHIARLLETEDTEALQSLLEQRGKPGREYAARQHMLEQIRANLLNGNDAEEQGLLARYPALPAARLHSLCAAARAEESSGQPRGAGRALFRFLANELP